MKLSCKIYNHNVRFNLWVVVLAVGMIEKYMIQNKRIGPYRWPDCAMKTKWVLAPSIETYKSWLIAVLFPFSDYYCPVHGRQAFSTLCSALFPYNPTNTSSKPCHLVIQFLRCRTSGHHIQIPCCASNSIAFVSRFWKISVESARSYQHRQPIVASPLFW